MTDFKVGDKVRVRQGAFTSLSWVGVEGIVKGDGLNKGQYKVELTDPKGSGHTVGYLANLGGNLELVEPPFTYEDIQVGDTIRRTRNYPSGSVEVREGTVGKQAYDYVTDGENLILAYRSDLKLEGVTLELLNRPEPKPTLLQNTRAGDQFTTTGGNGIKKVYTKRETGDWKALVLTSDGKAHSGFTWTSDELEREVESGYITEHTLIRA